MMAKDALMNQESTNTSPSPTSSVKKKKGKQDDDFVLKVAVGVRNNNASSVETKKKGKQEEDFVLSRQVAIGVPLVEQKSNTASESAASTAGDKNPQPSSVKKKKGKQEEDFVLKAAVGVRNKARAEVAIERKVQKAAGKPTNEATTAQAEQWNNHRNEVIPSSAVFGQDNNSLSPSDEQTNSGEFNSGELSLTRGMAIQPSSNSLPGAISVLAPGEPGQRLSTLSFNLLGVNYENYGSEEGDAWDGANTNTGPDHNNNSSNNNHDGLAVANPVVEEEEHDAQNRMEAAQPVDREYLDKLASEREAKEKQQSRRLCAFGVVACLVTILIVYVPFQLSRTTRQQKESNASAAEKLTKTTSHTSSPTNSSRPLPPMDNLELLYDELPEITKESLYDTDSPQYQAWEWLINHPNITTYPEWRKKQIFALTTFFYAFEGPLWPEVARNNWLNDTLHECSWMKTNVQFGMVGAGKHLQTTEYHPEDFLQCNDKGQVHLISLIYLQLGGANPFVPPEIGLLSSLVQFGACCNELDAPLQDMMPIEMLQLPKLKSINLGLNNLHGTIPQYFLQFKALKHMLLARNALTGTIPNEVGSRTDNQLKVLYLNHNSLTGSLPSELALLTSMTSLQLRENLVSGTVPSEIWSMTNLSTLYVGENHFTGNIPAEVGNMVGMEHLDMKECGFGGSIPSQIGLVTDMKRLWLSGNSLTGSIPHELTLMTDAQLLWLHDNHISGNVPEELWQLSQMRDLDLSSLPLLAGTVPEELCYLQRNESCIYQETLMVPDDFPCHLDFYCTELLCGCDCQCP